MTKRRFFLFGMMVFALLASTTPLLAQAGDRDGDGVPDRIDGCPSVPGPAENNGCPLPGGGGDTGGDTRGGDTGSGAADRDGDGVADFVDACPDAAGTGFTNGCPVESGTETTPGAPPQAIIPQIGMVWQSLSQCMVGVLPGAGVSVNIREEAKLTEAILGQLRPGQQFAALMVDYDAEGNAWFGGAPIGTPAGDGWGWVMGQVVSDNGQCANLPMILPLEGGFQPEIELILDPELLPDSIPYLQYKLTKVIVVQYDPVSQAPAPDGGTMATDDWNTQGSGIVWDWELEAEVSTVLPTSGFGMRFGDYIVTSYQTGGSDGQPNDTGMTYQNTFMVIPEMVDGSAFQPILLMQEVGEAGTEACAEIGGGMCVQAVLLLPAFGDEPGQCPPDAFGAGMQAAFGDGDTDGRDFLVWQRNVGSDTGITLPQYAINGNSLGLLLPAVQVIHDVNLKNSSTYANSVGDEGSEAGLGLTLNFAGDGSVMPTVEIEEKPEMVYQSIRFVYHCGVVVGVPDASGAWGWSVLLLPQMEG